ncbi:MAG TPA: Ig-like domain-containing protein, partial [Myxococcaceae bacterium]
MASRSLSLGWYVALSALVVGLTAGCGGGSQPPIPPSVKTQPDASKSTVVVNRNDRVLANGRDTVTITVTVRDEAGAAMADSTVTLEVTGDGNTLTPSSSKTNAEGVMTATLVSTRPGIKQVTASVTTDGAPVVLGSRPSVEFVALEAAKVAFTTTSIQATAGAPLPVLEVTLQDNTGATVTNAVNPVTLELATGPASAALEGTLTVNAVDGVARFTGLIIKKAGTGYSLRAKSGTLGAATSATFDVLPAAPSVLELTVLPASLAAGGTASATVLLKDAFDNVATNYTGTLRFSSSDGRAVLPPDTTFTAADAGQKAF